MLEHKRADESYKSKSLTPQCEHKNISVSSSDILPKSVQGVTAASCAVHQVEAHERQRHRNPTARAASIIIAAIGVYYLLQSSGLRRLSSTFSSKLSANGLRAVVGCGEKGMHFIPHKPSPRAPNEQKTDNTPVFNSALRLYNRHYQGR